MTTISIRTGSEGPRHDPYSFTEITVNGRAGEVTFHYGLGEWLALNGKKIKADANDLNSLFEKLVGTTPQIAEISVHRMTARRIRRHLRSCPRRLEARDCAGYPGESFLMCGCGAVLDSHFNRSEVE